MNETRHVVPNHFITSDVNRFPKECAAFAPILEGRSMLVHKADVFPVECVARGYIIGSGWKDYQNSGKICGIPIPTGLKMADKLPEPIFTPSTKASKVHMTRTSRSVGSLISWERNDPVVKGQNNRTLSFRGP